MQKVVCVSKVLQQEAFLAAVRIVFFCKDLLFANVRLESIDVSGKAVKRVRTVLLSDEDFKLFNTKLFGAIIGTLGFESGPCTNTIL